MASIKFQNVKKQYGSKDKVIQVIRDLTVNIDDGEFVVVVGPSGCGKSTLLRMVAGLEEISGGTISIDSQVVNDLEPAERDIAMVFQNYALYPHMSIFENMSYGLKIAKLPKDEIRRRVEKVSEILEITPYLQRKPGALSGGQRQRVAMGRAIVREPKVFLFDEPLSNLDAKLRAQTRLEIQKLHRELGITSLFVTHDQVEAMTLAERMIVLNAGMVEQFGTPDEVYHKPASAFVASFMGSPPMNLLTDMPGIMSGEIMGIRPEHLDIGNTGWDVSVEAIEMLGAERLVYCKWGSNQLIVRVHADDISIAVGARLFIKPREDKLHRFDQATGKRIG